MAIHKLKREIVKDIEREKTRFRVISRTLGQPDYLVDLAAHNGCGECPCKDWQTHRHPLIRRGIDDLDKVHCWHLEQAFRHYAIKKLEQDMAEQRDYRREHGITRSQEKEWNGE